MSFLQLPLEIHDEILSYLSPFFELKQSKLEETYFQLLKSLIPSIMSFRLIHPNYSKLIFCWILFDKVFNDLNITVKEIESLRIREKFTKIGIVKSLGSFLHLIRQREKQGNVFRRKFDSQIINALVIGRGGSGKTSIITRIIYGQFFPEYDPTCYDSYKRSVTVDQKDDTIYFEYMCYAEEDYLRNSYRFDILVIVCSMIDKNSLEDVESILKGNVDRRGIHLPCVIVMNKTDLPEWYEITFEMVNEIVESYKLTNCTILKTSAKTGDNIDKFMEECVRKYRANVKNPIHVLEEVLKRQKKGCQLM